MAKIHFFKSGKIYTARPGTELRQVHNANPSIPFKFGCCQGMCGTCVIKVKEGSQNLSKMTKQEFQTLKEKNRDAPYRLACQCAILGDIIIEE